MMSAELYSCVGGSDFLPPHFRVFEEIPHVEARFFTAVGGFSVGPYTAPNGTPGLNCAVMGSDRSPLKDLNRVLVGHAFGVEESHLLTTHEESFDVTIVQAPWDIKSRPMSEAMVTAGLSEYVLGILTSDCAPVLFADTKKAIIGATHVNWRGAMQSILEKTIEAMLQLGSNPSDIIAAIGPCAGGGSKNTYKVGGDFAPQRLKEDPDIGMFFKEEAGRTALHYQDYLVYRLKREGISTATVDIDTITDSRCYSSRGGDPPSSLMFSGIKLIS